jgi:hypothetical protein
VRRERGQCNHRDAEDAEEDSENSEKKELIFLGVCLGVLGASAVAFYL